MCLFRSLPACIDWNENFSQHIPQRFEAAGLVAALAECNRRIEILEAELKGLCKTDRTGPEPD
jgi:hypothetical protein